MRSAWRAREDIGRSLIWKGTSLLLLFAAVGAGCASRSVGYKISNETVAFIQPGSTAKSDVIENLGPPLLEIQNPHVLAYSWGKARGVTNRPVTQQDQAGVPGTAGYMAPPPPALTEESEMSETQRWIYCIALDSNDRVQRAGRWELQGAASLETAVRQWAAQGGRGHE